MLATHSENVSKHLECATEMLSIKPYSALRMIWPRPALYWAWMMLGPCLGGMIWGKLTRVILLPFGRNRLSAALALERYLHEFLDARWAWDWVLGIEWFLLFLPFHIETIRRTDPARRKNNGFFQEWKSKFFICSFMHHLFRTGSFIIICFEYWQYWHLKAWFVPSVTVANFVILK